MRRSEYRTKLCGVWSNRWTGARVRRAVWKGKAVELIESSEGDALDIPRSQTNLIRSRQEFFRVLENSGVYAKSPSE